MPKRRSPLRRNIVLFAVAVLLIAVAIGHVAVTRKPVLIMPPETPKELAMRQSPDNAYFTLEAAVKLLPKKPGVFVGPDPDYPNVRLPYLPRNGSLGKLLQIRRPDDDPQFERFIDDCAPAIAKTREAFTKPFYREPLKWSNFKFYGWNFLKRQMQQSVAYKLGLVLVAHGVQTQRLHGPDTASGADLLDALRLGALAMTDGRVYFASRLEVDALSRLDTWAHRASPEALTVAASRVFKTQGALPAPRRVLEFRWRVLDNTVDLDPADLHGPRGQVARYFFQWRLSAARRLVRRRREEFSAAVTKDWPAFQRWLRSQPELTKRHIFGPVYGVDPVDDLRAVARDFARLKTGYAGLITEIAVEQYQREHGVYPKSLDALVPVYLKTLPEDSMSEAPVKYRREGATYRLYSVGWDGKDNGGTGKYADIVFFRPAEAEE